MMIENHEYKHAATLLCTTQHEKHDEDYMTMTIKCNTTYDEQELEKKEITNMGKMKTMNTTMTCLCVAKHNHKSGGGITHLNHKHVMMKTVT